MKHDEPRSLASTVRLGKASESVLCQFSCPEIDDALTIRRFRLSDLDRWLAWPCHTDPLYKHHDPPTHRRQELFQHYQESLQRPDLELFSIVREKRQVPGDPMLGRLFLREVCRPAGGEASARLGYDLRPDIVGHGVGPRVLGHFLNAYFQTLGYQRLVLDVAGYNLRARRCYTRWGFRELWRWWSPDHPATQLPIFTDARFADVRPYFQMIDGRLTAETLEMALLREDFLIATQTR